MQPGYSQRWSRLAASLLRRRPELSGWLSVPGCLVGVDWAGGGGGEGGAGAAEEEEGGEVGELGQELCGETGGVGGRAGRSAALSFSTSVSGTMPSGAGGVGCSPRGWRGAKLKGFSSCAPAVGGGEGWPWEACPGGA